MTKLARPPYPAPYSLHTHFDVIKTRRDGSCDSPPRVVLTILQQVTCLCIRTDNNAQYSIKRVLAGAWGRGVAVLVVCVVGSSTLLTGASSSRSHVIVDIAVCRLI